MKPERILVVHRRSTYTDLVSSRRNARMTRLVKAGDPLVSGIVSAHKDHTESMRKVKKTLKKRGLNATWRHRIENLNPDDYDLVIAVGGDGTVLHASHSIGDTPVLAVNSSPSTSVGFFTEANADTFELLLDQLLEGSLVLMSLCRMEVRVNEKVVTSGALNDVLFCHDCPASTTRYMLSFGGEYENQLSSGVWVSTAAGSTAAIQSAGGRVMPPRSKRLQFVVREPFPSGGGEKQQEPTLVDGFISEGELLTIRSKTAAARLYVDGPHVVFPVHFGDVVTFSRSATPLKLFRNKKNKGDFA